MEDEDIASNTYLLTADRVGMGQKVVPVHFTGTEIYV